VSFVHIYIRTHTHTVLLSFKMGYCLNLFFFPPTPTHLGPRSSHTARALPQPLLHTRHDLRRIRKIRFGNSGFHTSHWGRIVVVVTIRQAEWGAAAVQVQVSEHVICLYAYIIIWSYVIWSYNHGHCEITCSTICSLYAHCIMIMYTTNICI
jgi:hypothetical protein